MCKGVKRLQFQGASHVYHHRFPKAAIRKDCSNEVASRSAQRTEQTFDLVAAKARREPKPPAKNPKSSNRIALLAL